MIVPGRNYELLGVDQCADAQTLRKAFHRLSKALHPDTTSLPIDEAEYRFRKVCEAYELLSDPIRREAYDESLKNEPVNKDSFGMDSSFYKISSKKTIYQTGYRRPLSGGELFSLLLLCIALLISLMLGIWLALINGMELQVTPSWLIINQFLVISLS